MSSTHTVGDGKDFSTIQAGIDDVPGDRSGQGEGAVQVFAKAAGYAESLDMNAGFSNTSETDFVSLTAMVSHEGIRGNGIEVDTGSLTTGIGLQLGFWAIVDGICFFRSDHKPSSSQWAINALNNSTVRNCIIYDSDSDVGEAVYGIAINGRVWSQNNQIMGIGRGYESDGGNGTGIWVNIGGADVRHARVENCVALDCSTCGIDQNGQNYTDFNNSYSGDSPSCFSATHSGSRTFEYCISSDGSAGSSNNNLSNKASAAQFVDTTQGAEDLHLVVGADCNRVGLDNSARFTTDAEGVTRINWNTGALEFVAADGQIGFLATIGVGK